MIAQAWLALALAAGITVGLAGVYFEGKRAGKAECVETQQIAREVAQQAAAAATEAAASAISKIRVQNRTVYSEVQREITEKPVYRDCVHSPSQLQRINAALTGEATEPPGDRGVPASDATR